MVPDGEGDDATKDAEGDVKEVIAKADALGLFGFDAVVFQWWTVYTFTDVVGREQVQPETQEPEIPFLDLGLMAQTSVREEGQGDSSERQPTHEELVSQSLRHPLKTAKLTTA